MADREKERYGKSPLIEHDLAVIQHDNACMAAFWEKEAHDKAMEADFKSKVIDEYGEVSAKAWEALRKGYTNEVAATTYRQLTV